MEGIKWAEANNTCLSIKSVTDSVPLELMPVCLSTAEICCVRQYRSNQCLVGMQAARDGNTCNRDAKNRTTFESDYYKDCCEACKIGLVMSTTVNQCGMKTFTFGSPWDEVSRTCCNELFDSNSFEIDVDESELNSMQYCALNLIFVQICLQRICAAASRISVPRFVRTLTDPTFANVTPAMFFWKTRFRVPQW